MYNKYQFNKNVLNEIIQLCNEKINRDFEDEELTKFLISNPNYSFNEGKRIFDDIVKGTENMIKLLKARKTYLTKHEEIIALDDITIDIYNNQLTFIVGDSGSGKSTLLNCLGGLDKINSGEILINNDSPSNNKCSTAFIFQEFQLIDNLTVYENLRLAINKDDRQKITKCLNDVSLTEFENKKVLDLSGGEKQRVAIARALVMDSDILLCDEPTGSLDEENTELIFEILKNISKTKMVIVASHDIQSATKYSDRIIKLKDGKVIKDNLNKNLDKPIISNGEKNFVKPKIPFSLMLKISFKYLFSKPVFAIFSFLLCLLSVTGLSISLSFNNDNPNAIVLDSMIENNVNATIYRKLVSNDENDSTWINISNFDIERISTLTNTEVYKVYDYETKISTLKNNKSKLYNDKIIGFVEINDDFLTSFGYTLEGRLPETFNEVIITKYIFDGMTNFGVTADDKQLFPSNVKDILNKKIYINNKQYVVCGVLDTNFNDNRYIPLLNSNNSYLEGEFEATNRYSLHNLLYFKEGFYHYYDDETKDSNTIDITFVLNNNDEFVNSFQSLSSNDISDKLITFIDGYSIDDLYENNIILPLSVFGLEESYILSEYIDDYANHNFNNIKDLFAADYPNECTIEKYISYILDNNYVDNYTNKTFKDIYYDCAIIHLNKKYNFSSNFTINMNIANNINYQKDINIIGIYYTDYYSNQNPVYCNNDFLKEVKEATLNYYDDVIFAVSALSNENSQLIESLLNTSFNDQKEYYDNEVKIYNNCNYKLISNINYSYETSQGQMNVLLTICGVLSIIMIVILFVYSYFQYSYIIINKSNNIGLLKTLNYSYSQIVLLFVLAPIIITLPICGLGNIISWFFIKALNLYQYKTTMILFNIYQLKSISILCSFVVLIFAILISILIFLRSKYNKSSIYLIREIDK